MYKLLNSPCCSSVECSGNSSVTHWPCVKFLSEDIFPSLVLKKKKKASQDLLYSLLMFQMYIRAPLHTAQFGCWCFSPQKDGESHLFQFNSSSDLNRVPSPETSLNDTDHSHRSDCFCLMCCPVPGSFTYPWEQCVLQYPALTGVLKLLFFLSSGDKERWQWMEMWEGILKVPLILCGKVFLKCQWFYEATFATLPGNYFS